jgi:syntaxin-binding protein 1
MQDLNPENKLRLLMIYAVAYPEKFEGDKGEKLMQVVLSSSLFINIHTR